MVQEDDNGFFFDGTTAPNEYNVGDDDPFGQNFLVSASDVFKRSNICRRRLRTKWSFPLITNLNRTYQVM